MSSLGDPEWERAVMVAVAFALRHGEAWVPAAIQDPGRAQAYARDYCAAHGHATALNYEVGDEGVRLVRAEDWRPDDLPPPPVRDPG